MPVLMMSGHATVDAAVRATRLGASDFLEKPVSTDRLLLVIETRCGSCAPKQKRSSFATKPAKGATSSVTAAR